MQPLPMCHIAMQQAAHVSKDLSSNLDSKHAKVGMVVRVVRVKTRMSPRKLLPC